MLNSILSPPDSLEWPTIYIRGSKGLEKQVESIKGKTQNNLGYIGEWHSHPDNARCSMSKDDKEAFAWLNEIMTAAGLRTLMLIVCDKGQYSFFFN